MEIEERPDELYHHGRKGMKWYQNIFSKGKTGSGRKKKASRTDQGEDGDSKPKPKSHKEMSDDELRKETDRLNLEANYLSAKSRAIPQSSNPQQKNESFSKKFVNEAIKPAIIAAGRKQIENYLNTKISDLTKGEVDPNSIEALRKEAERMGLKSKISTAKKVLDLNEQYFKEQKEKADRKAAVQKQVDDYNNSGHKDDIPGNNRYSKSGDDIVDRKTPTGKATPNRPLLEQIDRYEATGKDVEGEGTSRYIERDRGPVKDVVYDGQRYVEQLLQLEDKSKRR